MQLNIFRIFGASCLTAALNACTPGAKEPVVVLNPHPQNAYALTISTRAAPGPFDSVTAEVAYAVDTRRCLDYKERFEGVTVDAEHRVNIPIKQINATTYAGVMYADLIQNQDYYHLGVCHWGINIINVGLSLNHQSFDAAIDEPTLLGQKTDTDYFSLQDYANVKAKKSLTGFGFPDSSPVHMNIPDFKITITSKHLGPAPALPVPPSREEDDKTDPATASSR